MENFQYLVLLFLKTNLRNKNQSEIYCLLRFLDCLVRRCRYNLFLINEWKNILTKYFKIFSSSMRHYTENLHFNPVIFELLDIVHFCFCICVLLIISSIASKGNWQNFWNTLHMRNLMVLIDYPVISFWHTISPNWICETLLF